MLGFIHVKVQFHTSILQIETIVVVDRSSNQFHKAFAKIVLPHPSYGQC
jgi:hypothetical protein